MIGLHGTEADNPDDPFWLVPPSPLDAPALHGPLSKDRREDLQMLSFAMALSLHGRGDHPVEIARGGDPPDRLVTAGGAQVAVELTELTSSDIRRELAQARHIGRRLQVELARDAARFGHLVGRHVALAMVPSGEEDGLDEGALLAALCNVLEEDRGCVGDGVDVSAGFPDRWPNDRGFYGKHGPAILMTYRDAPPGELLVSSSCQASIKLTEVLEAVRERIESKDRECNDWLLMSCGMPDSKGYVCLADHFMFRFLQEHASLIKLRPAHLKGVSLHRWGSTDWIELFRAPSARVAWPPSRVP